MTESDASRDLRDRFLHALERIRSALEDLYDTPYVGVGAAVRDATKRGHPIITRNDQTLKLLIELRNTLTHSALGGPVATPSPGVVDFAEGVLEKLENPTPVSKVMTTNPVTVGSNEPLSSILRLVIDNSLSQVPVCDDEAFVGLLTTNMIARWLSATATRDGGLVDIDGVTAADLMCFAEDQDQAVFLNPRASTVTACTKLTGNPARAAVLITSHGRAAGAIQGILTPSDVPTLLSTMRVPFRN